MKKRIVVCSDGTWNTPDAKEGGQFHTTNVVKIAYSIAPQSEDGVQQVVFYDEGLGTHWGLDRLTGGAFGQGISKNVRDAYRFLVNNFQPGDEIFLFGFSRGAFTVRSAAGLIRKCGILRKENAKLIDRAYKLYKKRDASPDSEEAQQFRNQYAYPPPVSDVPCPRIKLIGVWDTVGSLGVPGRGLRFLTRKLHRFHDTQLSRYVDYGFHALAIDEKRKPFRPTLWEPSSNPEQHVEQVWFAGVHSDVGGGYPQCGLSDLAFRWMVGRAKLAKLAFVETAFARDHLDIHPDPSAPIHNSKKGLYRITRSLHRPIGEEPGRAESVHPSVFERWESVPEYRPGNLLDYWEANPDKDPR